MRKRLSGKQAILLMSVACVSGSVVPGEIRGSSDANEFTIDPRIVGGSSISIEQAAPTVALVSRLRVEYDGDLFQAQFCGGTVIASQWVLTAAHCVVDERRRLADIDSMLVLTGSADLSSPVNQPIPVTRIIPFPLYTTAEGGHDIALIELEYDAMVTPIALDTQPLELNEKAFIAGWGAINQKVEGSAQFFPKQLQGTFVNLFPGRQCGELFPAYNGLTSDTTICAGLAEGGPDTCQGDSGGPLYRVDTVENRISAVTGITSWGFGCGVQGFPGVYTSVNSYTSWIRGTMAGTIVQRDVTMASNTFPSTTTMANDGSNSSSNSPDKSRSGALFATLLPLFGLMLWRFYSARMLVRKSAMHGDKLAAQSGRIK